MIYCICKTREENEEGFIVNHSGYCIADGIYGQQPHFLLVR